MAKSAVPKNAASKNATLRSATGEGGLFPALLKHWRRNRGLSQLDLALTADVSSRHVSFLETGRSQPSQKMVLQLAAAMGVPLRHQNEMLTAAGFLAAFDTPESSELPENIRHAIERLKAQQEPYPLAVMDRLYNVLDINASGMRLSMLLNSGGPPPTNGMQALFDPGQWQPFVSNFAEVGRDLLWRMQREALAHPGDQGRAALVDEILALGTVDDAWREIDLTSPSQPTLSVELERDGLRLSFFTMVTALSAPQNVTTQELQIESYFPADAATADLCAQLAADAGA